MSAVVADLSAMVDLIAKITEESDSYGFEEAVALQAALQSVKTQADLAIKMLNTTMLKQLEAGSREIDGVVYVSVPDRIERHDHHEIGLKVQEDAVNRAVNRLTGEVSAAEAAANAVESMAALYVSPSTKAKSTPWKGLGIDPKRVVSKEDKGRKVHVVETAPKDD